MKPKENNKFQAPGTSMLEPVTLDALSHMNALEQKELEMQRYRAKASERKRRIRELEIKLKYKPNDEAALEELCKIIDEKPEPVPDVIIGVTQVGGSHSTSCADSSGRVSSGS